MDSKKEWLQVLHNDNNFQEFVVKELEAKRPKIPNWNRGEDNTDDWKFISAQQAGFDLALAVLELKLDRN